MSTRKIKKNANALVLTSAFYHPDEKLRQSLRLKVDTWLEELKPEFRKKDLKNIILKEKGTPLEPFRLEKDDIDFAATLATAAFSKKGGQSRFRVVSRETIGNKGGLVITNNLKSYYAERYVLGKYKRNPKSGFAFFPTYLPSSIDHKLIQIMKSTSILIVDEEGFNIRIPWPHSSIESGKLARNLQIHSRISDVDETFDHLGLRVEADVNHVEVRTGSPESQIKVMAYMMGQQTMNLSQEISASGELKAYVVLEAPVQDEMPLKSIFTASDASFDWVICSFQNPILIDSGEMLAISKVAASS